MLTSAKRIRARRQTVPQHHHHHSIDPDSGDRRIWIAVTVNVALTVIQIVAGIFSGSLALIADAVHNLSDALSLVIAFVARRIARRPADARMTFGYGRIEVVAALINYTTLIVVALYLATEGLQRLFAPQDVEGWIVVIVAGAALAVDVITALLVMRMARDSVNIRAAFLHNVADALASVAVVVAGTFILLFDWRLIDPIVTLGIAAYILWHAGREIIPVIQILMMGSPESPSTDEVVGFLRGKDGVKDVHHLHLWRMQEHETALEAHVVMAPDAVTAELRGRLKTELAERFGIRHAMLEFEEPGTACVDAPIIGH